MQNTMVLSSKGWKEGEKDRKACTDYVDILNLLKEVGKLLEAAAAAAAGPV